MTTAGKLPLAGVRVLELGHIVAGPTSGQILADLGADVTKLESIDGGDQARKMPGPMQAMFSFLNRNKRSIALDLKGEGAEIFKKLAANADVIIDNFGYGVVDRLGLGYEVVHQFNPGVVWLSIKGHLPGPREAQPMLDEVAQMAGGLAFMTGSIDMPSRAGASIIDVGAATYGTVGILAALRERDTNGGEGQFITAGLFETAAYLVGQWMAAAQYANEQSIPVAAIRQGTRMGFAVYRLFDTKDKSRIFVGITSNAHWQRFCVAMNRPDLYADERFVDNASRLAHRNTLNPMLQEIFNEMTRAEIDVRLRVANIPVSPLRRPDELAEEEHLNVAGQLMQTPLLNGRSAKLPKLPFRASGFEMEMRRAPPKLGEDSTEVLRELGYTEKDIERLIANGAVLATAPQEKETA